MATLDDWMKSGEYLPPPMRDFHDAKELFKSIHDIVDVEKHDYAKSVDWVTGQCYVVDIFLWFMARRGYTLQRSRKQGVDFRSLEADVKSATDARRDSFFSALKDHMNCPKESA